MQKQEEMYWGMCSRINWRKWCDKNIVFPCNHNSKAPVKQDLYVEIYRREVDSRPYTIEADHGGLLDVIIQLSGFQGLSASIRSMPQLDLAPLNQSMVENVKM